MKFLRVVFSLLVATTLVGLGCTSSAAHAGGATCSVDGDCASGACLPLAVFDGDGGVIGAPGSCRIAGKACSKACSIDGDCASLGTGFKCFEGCPLDGGAPGPMACGATL